MSPGFSDAIEASTVGSLTRHLDTKFVIGFDFAVTLSSPASSCVLFDVALHLLMEHVEQTQKMVPLITSEIDFGQYVCELVFGLNVIDLDLGVQIDSIKQPIKSNSVGAGNMSHCRTSPFMIIFITASLSSNIHNIASLLKQVPFEETKINTIQIINLSMNFLSR